MPIADGVADFSFSSLLRMMRLNDVLAEDESTVAHLATATNAKPTSLGAGADEITDPEEHLRIVREVGKIREEHDVKVERAVKAVGMLKDGRKKRLEEKRKKMEAVVKEEKVPEEEGESRGSGSGSESGMDEDNIVGADAGEAPAQVPSEGGVVASGGGDDDDDDDDLESVFGGKLDYEDSPDNIDQENIEMALVEDLPPDEL
jgi:hypothetical protein